MNRANWAILMSLALVGLITPYVTAQQPEIVAEQPKVAADEPKVVVDEPKVAAEEPDITEPLPAPPPEQPAPAAEEVRKQPTQMPLLPEPSDPRLLKQPASENLVLGEPPCSACPIVSEPISLGGGTFAGSPVGTCCAVCGGGACCPDLFYTRQGTRILSHSKPRGVQISRDFNAGAGTFSNVMNTRNIGFSGAAGYDVTIGRYLGRDADNRDHFLEFTYWGLNNWQSSAAVRGSRVNYGVEIGGSLFSNFPSDVGGFNRADEHTIAYESGMHNFEFNLRLRPRSRADRLVLHPNGRWRRECQPGDYASYLIGFRVFSIDENFDFNSTGLVNGANVSGDYHTNAHNDLVGFQIGWDYIHRQCKWSYGFRTKVGPFVNFSDQTTRVVTNATADLFVPADLNISRYAKDNLISLIGEVGFITEYKLRPNFTVYGAYDLMWITSLALAPEQLDFDINPPSRVNSGGMLFSHGLSLGFVLSR